MWDRRGIYWVLVGKPEGKIQLGDLRADRGILLRWISGKQYMGVWTGSSWLRIETDGGTCESGNELSGSRKCGEFLE